MYRLRKQVEMRDKKATFIGIGDIHYGSPNCKIKKVKELVEWIKNKPACYVIGMGDYLDCIIPTDPRYDATTSYTLLDSAVRVMEDILAPIKDRILVMITGGHELKIAKKGYGDPTLRICRELNVPYGGFSCFLKVQPPREFHNRAVMFYIQHGWSAGRLTGNKVNNIERLAQYYEADVYMAGHSHDCWSTKRIKIGYNGATKKLFVNTGTFLETATWGTTGYSEVKGFPPLDLGVVKITWEIKRNNKNKLTASE